MVGNKLTRGINGAFIGEANPPSPKQRGHRVGQGEGRVAGNEWDKKGE